MSGFSSSVFKFTTIVPDDGKDEAGGWQAATASLKFYRWTGLFPDLPWTCSVTVGMPLRAAAYGTISHTYAATISAGIASQAGMDLMHAKPQLPQARLIYGKPEQCGDFFRSCSLIQLSSINAVQKFNHGFFFFRKTRERPLNVFFRDSR